MFVGDKWTNISVVKMYQFLGILLKMSLISSDINGFKSLWYPPTHASISPTCQFVIKDYPSWTKTLYVSFKICSNMCSIASRKWTSQERDKCHQLRYVINHLNKAAKHTFTPWKEMPFNESGISSKSNHNSQSRQII